MPKPIRMALFGRDERPTRVENDVIREHVERIVRSGILGRSRSYAKLLTFLTNCALDGRVPKEHEIATEVFRRPADFDSSEDAVVRVYAHHLRRKLEGYYGGAGRHERQRIALPKGEYRLVILPAEGQTGAGLADWLTPEVEMDSAAEPAVPPLDRSARRATKLAALFAVFALGITLGAVFALLGSAHSFADETRSPAELAAQAPIWRALLDDDVPILVVVGDYYIFGELDDSGNVDRMVRNFSINSPADLDRYLMEQPELAKRYIDLDLTYLPLGTAVALHDLLGVAYTSSKTVDIKSMSQLSAADLTSNHILYVGYISGLDKLLGFVFASSGLSIGETYDQLVDLSSGKVYTSGAGTSPQDRNYRDYGLLSTFEGPGGHQYLIVAGTRDAGLMETAHAASDPSHLEAVDAALPDPADAPEPSFEVLYEVAGFDRTNLDDVIVHAQPLSPRHNWGAAIIPAG